MNHLLKTLVVYFALDSTPEKEFMVAPDTINSGRCIACYLSDSAQEIIPLVFSDLGLQSHEQFGYGLYQE